LVPLAPDDIVLFDNERILHGREAFSEASERLLKGCYSDRDGLLATLARLSAAAIEGIAAQRRNSVAQSARREARRPIFFQASM
jgi:hypothetical protein